MPIVQASGAMIHPSSRSSESGWPATSGSRLSIQLNMATKAMNAINIAPTFNARVKPSEAPRPYQSVNSYQFISSCWSVSPRPPASPAAADAANATNPPAADSAWNPSNGGNCCRRTCCRPYC